MTSRKQLAKLPKWVKVYKEEINYRRTLKEEDLETYKEMMRSNPKGLEERCKKEGCVFVPATYLWIHDDKADTNLDGYRIRAFREALPYKDGDYQVVPQICWNCERTRDHHIRRKVVKSVEAQIYSDSSRRKRRRPVSRKKAPGV